MRTASLIAVAALPLAALTWDTAGAASCREELQDFERRLYESSLAAEDPAEYAKLTRQVEEISELRDEALCAERLAGLNERLPDAGRTAGQGAGARD